MIRGITGVGKGKGPYIALHDPASGSGAGFMTGADRVAIDLHPYFAFGGGAALDPIDTGTGADAGGTWPKAACTAWAPMMNTR